MGKCRVCSVEAATVPLMLLAFYPCYVMNDLIRTSKKQAQECQKAAEKYLPNTRIGDIHLLS